MKKHNNGVREHGVSYMAIARAWLVGFRENPKQLDGAVIPKGAHRKLALLGATEYEQRVARHWVGRGPLGSHWLISYAHRVGGRPAGGGVLPAPGRRVYE